MKWLRWQKGRQQTGYDKMLLAGLPWPVAFDCYLLRFNQGSVIPPHTDKNDKGKHVRLNLVLKQAKQGGEFICDETLYESKRIKLFRPDLHPHQVTEIKQGTRWVLSVGWLKRR